MKCLQTHTLYQQRDEIRALKYELMQAAENQTQ